MESKNKLDYFHPLGLNFKEHNLFKSVSGRGILQWSPSKKPCKRKAILLIIYFFVNLIVKYAGISDEVATKAIELGCVDPDKGLAYLVKEASAECINNAKR